MQNLKNVLSQTYDIVKLLMGPPLDEELNTIALKNNASIPYASMWTPNYLP